MTRKQTLKRPSFLLYIGHAIPMDMQSKRIPGRVTIGPTTMTQIHISNAISSTLWQVDRASLGKYKSGRKVEASESTARKCGREMERRHRQGGGNVTFDVI